MFINLADAGRSTPSTPTTSRSIEEVDELVQEEPVEALDAERAGQLAAIGIVKGRPFAPDDRMRAILDRTPPGSAAAWPAPSRTPPAIPDAVLYGSWKNAFVGGSYEFLRNGARLLDARTQFHYLATVITPAMAHAQVGAGSAYAYTVHDANGDLLDGARTYRLHVDPDPPAKNFWAVDVYDTQTRSLLQVAIDDLARPGQQLRHPPSQRRRLLRPLLRTRRRPTGRSRTGSRPSPASHGFSSFRIYGPLKPWFDQTWRLNEFEPID